LILRIITLAQLDNRVTMTTCLDKNEKRLVSEKVARGGAGDGGPLASLAAFKTRVSLNGLIWSGMISGTNRDSF
jgi:hypothetical protein